MSFNTIPGTEANNNSDPNSYLDSKSAAVVSVAGLEGISGWIFDIPTGESIDLETDITDHYTENGSFVNDHAVNKPIKISLSGLIGELVYSFPEQGLAADFAALTSALSVVPAYFGPLTPQAAQGANEALQTAGYVASQFEALKKRAQGLKDLFSGVDATETLQQKAFAEITAMRNSKQIVSVQTPWGFSPSMMIQTISARQDEKSNDVTDFSITLKEMRFADIQVTEFNSNEYQSAIDVQNSAPAEIGEVQGKEQSSSLLYQVFGGGN